MSLLTARKLMSRIFGRKSATARSAPKARARLGCESLERRDCPAYISGGNLYIDGTNAADTVSVSQTIPANMWEIAKVQVVQNGVTQTFSKSLIRSGQVYFQGYGGNDSFQNSAYLYIYADGGTGADMLSGGPMDDILIGGTNNDSLYGNDGNDTVYGGQGTDEMRGGAGNDTLAGDGDNDTMRGGPGSDVLYGNDGHDTMYGDNNAGVAGGVGNDTMYGGAGNDTMAGEGGNDYVRGELGSDVLYGNDGNDIMYGDNAGNPWGGEAADWLYGGAGDDTLAGEGGNDYVRGELGSDVLYGNDGNDIMYGDNAGNPWGGEMADKLYGGWGNDTMAGEGGDDFLYGEGDSDAVYGNSGSDWLEAGSAAEYAPIDGADWNAHVWAVNGTGMNDIDQMASATCVFLSSLAGSANHHYLENNISYEGYHTYAVQLFDVNSEQWVTERVWFDGSMVMNLTGDVVDPISKFGEFWTVVYQRAYLQHIGIDPYNGELYDDDDSNGNLGDDNAVDPFDGEPNSVRAIRTITGLAADVSSDFDLATMTQQLAEGRVLTAGGTGHRYTVLDIVQDEFGNTLVRLRNPWATDDVHSPNTGGTIDFNAEGLDDGVITVTWDTFSNTMNFRNYDFSG